MQLSFFGVESESSLVKKVIFQTADMEIENKLLKGASYEVNMTKPSVTEVAKAVLEHLKAVEGVENFGEKEKLELIEDILKRLTSSVVIDTKIQ